MHEAKPNAVMQFKSAIIMYSTQACICMKDCDPNY